MPGQKETRVTQGLEALATATNKDEAKWRLALALFDRDGDQSISSAEMTVGNMRGGLPSELADRAMNALGLGTEGNEQGRVVIRDRNGNGRIEPGEIGTEGVNNPATLQERIEALRVAAGAAPASRPAQPDYRAAFAEYRAGTKDKAATAKLLQTVFDEYRDGTITRQDIIDSRDRVLGWLDGNAPNAPTREDANLIATLTGMVDDKGKLVNAPPEAIARRLKEAGLTTDSRATETPAPPAQSRSSLVNKALEKLANLAPGADRRAAAAEFATRVLDTTGGDRGAPDGKVDMRDLNAIDRNNDGKLSREELEATAKTLSPKAREAFGNMIQKALGDNQFVEVEKLAQGLRQLGVMQTESTAAPGAPAAPGSRSR